MVRLMLSIQHQARRTPKSPLSATTSQRRNNHETRRPVCCLPLTCNGALPPMQCASHVLVCDDNEDTANSLSFLLEHSGYRVSTTYRPRDALQVVERERPFAACLDIGLPGLNGWQLAEAIRSIYGADVLLVAISGYSSKTDKQRSLDSGFDFHFAKPVDFRVLEPILAEFCGRLHSQKTASPAAMSSLRHSSSAR